MTPVAADTTASMGVTAPCFIAVNSKMSDRPAIAELQEALSDLSWDEFVILAIHFKCKGLHVPFLKQIKQDYDTTKIRVLYGLQGWLDRDTEASWEKIIIALGKIGKNDLAHKVRSQYCTVTVNSSAIPSPLSTPPLSTHLPPCSRAVVQGSVDGMYM